MPKIQNKIFDGSYIKSFQEIVDFQNFVFPRQGAHKASRVCYKICTLRRKVKEIKNKCVFIDFPKNFRNSEFPYQEHISFRIKREFTDEAH